MSKFCDLTNNNDMHIFLDILLKTKTTTSLVDGILEIFCSYGGAMTHSIQFCRW